LLFFKGKTVFVDPMKVSAVQNNMSDFDWIAKNTFHFSKYLVLCSKEKKAIN